MGCGNIRSQKIEFYSIAGRGNDVAPVSESVEQHTVQNRSLAFDFEVLKNLVNLIIKVFTLRHPLHELMKEKRAYRSLLLIVLR